LHSKVTPKAFLDAQKRKMVSGQNILKKRERKEK
jgi:hypothetical protein